MIVKPRIKPGPADISDLRKNPVVQWQYRNYFAIALIWGIIFPAAIPGYFWRDWRGGYFYACFFRMVVVHHVRSPPSAKNAPNSLICENTVYFRSQFFSSLVGRKHIR